MSDTDSGFVFKANGQWVTFAELLALNLELLARLRLGDPTLAVALRFRKPTGTSPDHTWWLVELAPEVGPCAVRPLLRIANTRWPGEGLWVPWVEGPLQWL